MIPRSICAVFACFLAVLPAFAHGGMYRGPTDPGVPTPGWPGPGGPTTPGGLPPGPTTGGVAPDLTRWQLWWEFNKDPMLQLKSVIHGQAGGDVIPNPTVAGIRLAPTPEDRAKRILPALIRALEGETNRDIATACMVAIAKLGVDKDPDGRSILPLLTVRLRERDQEVRETAALALGISGIPAALDDLIALHTDSPAGRRLVDRESVDDRTRSFAGYALGLLADRSADIALKERAFAALHKTLAEKEAPSRDIKVAAIHGLRLLAPAADGSSKGKRLLWQVLPVLQAYLDKDLGRSWQIAQAHVPTAFARLLGRGHGADHQRTKAAFVEALQREPRPHQSLLQSYALALGAMAEPAEVSPDDAVVSAALKKLYEQGKDQQARHFALIALGQIGGESNVSALLQYLKHGNEMERPWASLALGLVGWAQREAGTAPAAGDPRIGAALRAALERSRLPDTKAGVAIALGLCGSLDAAADLLALLHRHRNDDSFAGYLCLSLALMREPTAVEPVRKVVKDAVRRPELMKQASIALALLGDANAADLLLQILADGDLNVARLAAVARAVGLVGDRRTIDPLLRLLADQDLTKLARAFSAAALGGVGDRDPLPWHAKIAPGLNYRATVETLTDQRAGVLDIL